MSLKAWSAKYEIAFEFKNKEPARSKKSSELVSVCVTLFNYAKYIKDCLDSIAAQTYENLELIIVDDRSTKDDSLAVAVAWAEANKDRFVRVCVVTHALNQGPAEARNTGFSLAQGSYVFIIDADNEIYPRAVEALTQAAKAGGFDATYSQLELFGDKKGVGAADLWDPVEVRKDNYVDVMALVSKDAWAAVGGFSHIEEGWEDYDFWLKFIDHKMQAGYVPQILCRYRVHKISRTHTEAFVSHDNLKLLMLMRHPVYESRHVHDVG